MKIQEKDICTFCPWIRVEKYFLWSKYIFLVWKAFIIISHSALPQSFCDNKFSAFWRQFHNRKGKLGAAGRSYIIYSCQTFFSQGKYMVVYMKIWDGLNLCTNKFGELLLHCCTSMLFDYKYHQHLKVLLIIFYIQGWLLRGRYITCAWPSFVHPWGQITFLCILFHISNYPHSSNCHGHPHQYDVTPPPSASCQPCAAGSAAPSPVRYIDI